jgi:hypothetical protein
MMTPRRILLVLLAVLAFYQAGRENHRLVERRHAFLPKGVDPLENASPMVAFTSVAMGGLRGVLADILWIRLGRLQDEGKYFEINQLSRWITTLEPRIPEVWAFHAWNMSYNVSVLFNDPADRWRWVRAGISLLRDEGLRHNPKSPRICWDLAWIFFHKMGQELDQMHQYYKLYWAAEVESLLSGPSPDYTAFAALPDKLENLRSDPEVDALVTALEAGGFDLKTLRPKPGASSPEKLQELLDQHPGGERLKLFLGRELLRTRLGMDLVAMQAVDNAYGPLDWRLPESHALYWALLGLPGARDFEKSQLDRIVYHSVVNAFRRGRLQIHEKTGKPLFSPNLAMLDRALATMDAACAAHPQDGGIANARKFFLIDAVMILYQYNQTERSREIFTRLAQVYPEEVGGRAYEDFLIAKYVTEDMDTLSRGEAIALVEGSLFNGYLQLALGESNRATGYARYARQVYDRYQKAHCVDKEQKDRVCLEAFDVYRATALERAREWTGESLSSDGISP